MPQLLKTMFERVDDASVHSLYCFLSQEFRLLKATSLHVVGVEWSFHFSALALFDLGILQRIFRGPHISTSGEGGGGGGLEAHGLVLGGGPELLRRGARGPFRMRAESRSRGNSRPREVTASTSQN